MKSTIDLNLSIPICRLKYFFFRSKTSVGVRRSSPTKPTGRSSPSCSPLHTWTSWNVGKKFQNTTRFKRMSNQLDRTRSSSIGLRVVFIYLYILQFKNKSNNTCSKRNLRLIIITNLKSLFITCDIFYHLTLTLSLTYTSCRAFLKAKYCKKSLM